MTILARLLALILVAVLPSFAILLYNEHVLRAAREEQLRQEALIYAKVTADELERIVEGVRSFLLVVAQAPPIQAADWSGCGPYLTKLADIHPGYAQLAVVDRTGRAACASAPDLSDLAVTDRPYLQDALAGASFAIGGFLSGQGTGIGILPFAAAIRAADGQVRGAFMAGLRIDWLGRQLEQKARPADCILLVADRQGTILVRSSDPGQWLGQPIGPAWRPFTEAGAPGTTTAVDMNGVRRAYGYVPPNASLARLFVAAGIGTAQGVRDIEAASRRGLVVAAAAGLVALVLAWIVGDRLIRQPVRRLVGFAHDLGLGRYQQAAPSEPGEFGALCRAFGDAARKLASREEELRASEMRYHRLADLTREGIAIHDGERIFEANDLASVMFGYQPGEAIGRPLMAFIAPEAHAEVRARIAAESEGPYESIGLRKDGSYFPIEVYAHGIDYESRSMRVIVVRDLTLRKQAEEALRQAEERYRLAVCATKDMIWDWDIETNRIQANDAAQTLFGYAEETVTFDWWADRLHPDDRTRVLEALRAAIDGTVESWDAEYRFRRANGSWADVLDRGLIMRAPDGRATRMIGVAMDLTDRKRIEAALRRAAERNQALLREADHRIKNNLQLVSSMLGLQRNSLRDPETRQALQDARMRIQAIARVHQSFYSSGDLERADFGEVLRTLRDSLRSDGKNQPEIIVEGSPGCLISAGKATPLALIANELVTNALKHAFEPGQRGRVTMGCTHDPGGDIVLTVADDGKGLPPAFDLANAGFGLRLVLTLARQIGGRVAVRREAPGAAIEVRVPSDVA